MKVGDLVRITGYTSRPFETRSVFGILLRDKIVRFNLAYFSVLTPQGAEEISVPINKLDTFLEVIC